MLVEIVQPHHETAANDSFGDVMAALPNPLLHPRNSLIGVIELSGANGANPAAIKSAFTNTRSFVWQKLSGKHGLSGPIGTSNDDDLAIQVHRDISRLHGITPYAAVNRKFRITAAS